MNPLVSIILPTHNGQHFLSQSIESCLNQTYKNIELIIVDDASTDDSPLIIRHYSHTDSRIKILTNQKNQKLPKTLNIGQKACSGEFITWTSDDNFFHPNAIEFMLNKLLEDNSIDMVYCDFSIVDSEQVYQRLVTVQEKEKLSEWNCIGPCFLYSRLVSETVGLYSNKVIYAEDYDYWLRIASQFSLTPIHQPLYFYREHAQSLTSLVKSKRIHRSKELAIARNLSKLPWLTNEDKLEKSLAHMQKAITRRETKIFAWYFYIAFRLSPMQTLRSLLSRVARAIFQ